MPASQGLPLVATSHRGEAVGNKVYAFKLWLARLLEFGQTSFGHGNAEAVGGFN